MTKYIDQERAKWWPVSPELLAQYKDGTHTTKDSDGSLFWYQNDQLHRDLDKPAVIGASGALLWCQNDLWHRDEDKPAAIGADGSLAWWQNGGRHRFRGPAVIKPDGTLEWWVNGENITQEVRKWLNRKPWHGTPEQIAEFQLRFT